MPFGNHSPLEGNIANNGWVTRVASTDGTVAANRSTANSPRRAGFTLCCRVLQHAAPEASDPLHHGCIRRDVSGIAHHVPNTVPKRGLNAAPAIAHWHHVKAPVGEHARDASPVGP